LDQCADQSCNSALRHAFSLIHSIYGEISYSAAEHKLDNGVFLKFVTCAPKEFVTMLQDGEEPILILFAFWIILSVGVQQTWFCNSSLGQSGIKILRQIISPHLQPWLDWPEEQLRVKLRALREEC
jgi:hypothetical protein